MKRVELIKGMDYRGHGVRASLGEPFTVPDDKASELVKTGFFKSYDVEEHIADSTNGDGVNSAGDGSEAQEDKPIEKMKKEELIAFAAEKGIDLSDCTNNDERIEMIKDVLASGNDAEADFGE